MASINGVSSGNKASSLYNSAKTISGLASGLDTEGMIEGLVQGYSTKITSLNQKATKIEWKQEAYRSIISKMSSFSNKYMSYSSSTNLMSSSFFNNAIKVATQGVNADKVTASGKSTSEIQLNSVTQLAAAARYTTASEMNTGSGNSITASAALNLTDNTTLGTLQGSLSITYGDKVISLSFDEVADQIAGDNAQYSAQDKAKALAKAIETKLADQNITFTSGGTVKASERIEVKAGEDGTITFSDKGTGGNSVYLSAASSSIKEALGLNLDNAKEDKPATITLTDATALKKEISTAEYLSGKSMNLTLDKLTKSIKLPEIVKTGEGEEATYQIKNTDGTMEPVAQSELNEKYKTALQGSLNKAFGTNKVKAELDEDGKLKFTPPTGSDLLINTSVGGALGIGKTASTYLNTDKTLGELLPSFGDGLTPAMDIDNNELKDKDGNNLYEFKLNDVVIGNYSKDSKLSEVMSAINANAEAGVKVSYSKTSKQFVFNASDTGSQGKIEMGAGLAQTMFGAPAEGTGGYTKGVDAEFVVNVNGTTLEKMTRSSNSVEIDGMTLNFKETFTEGAVTFKPSADSDKIITAVKSMIDDYNAMVTEIKKSYSTLPAQKSNGKMYDPLTDDDLSSMSESAIKQYEEKAKQGLLFGDSDISGLYEKLNSVFNQSGSDGAMLRWMGINTAYSTGDGVSTISFDQEKMRQALESNPDAVVEAFTKSTEAGAATKGIMQGMKTQLDNYGRLNGATKGILVERAGTPLSALSLLGNTYQKQIDAINKEIESWQDKLATKVDSYTSQFTRLETLINQMNSQSAALSSMMGG